MQKINFIYHTIMYTHHYHSHTFPFFETDHEEPFTIRKKQLELKRP